jgi:mandelamide amidase
MSAAVESLTAVEAVAHMRAGDLACEDYARELLDRAGALAWLNAFRTLDRERVLEQARDADRRRSEGKALGRLHGLPIPVKDSINTRDLPTTNGTRALADFRPAEDAAVLGPLLREGALVMGKANLHELSRGWTGNNGAFGAILNPYDPRRIPGGSSGGSAAAVAARMAPLALGEDTLGSIRVPASFCGVIGFRPTFGRYPGEGIMPLTFGRFDQAGPFANAMADIVLFDDVLVPSAPLAQGSLEGMRLGLPEFLWSDLDPEVERVAEAMVHTLEAAGATIVREQIPDAARAAYDIARQVIGYENLGSIAAFLERHGGPTFEAVQAGLSPNLQQTYRLEFQRGDYDAALAARAAIAASMAEHFARHRLDALVFPPVLAPAPPLGDNAEIALRGRPVPQRWVMARNTALSSCTEFPSLTLPAGLTREGLPVGVEFLGRHGEDRALLAAGVAVERACGRIAPPKI